MVCVVLALALGARAQTTLPCDASPEVKQALRSLPQDAGRTAIINACRVLLERFPNDQFVHERYQDAANYPSTTERDAVIGEYGIRRWHALQLRLPWLGPLVRGVNTSRFASTLAILVGGGVPLLSALASGTRVMTNMVMQEAVEGAIERVREVFA